MSNQWTVSNLDLLTLIVPTVVTAVIVIIGCVVIVSKMKKLFKQSFQQANMQEKKKVYSDFSATVGYMVSLDPYIGENHNDALIQLNSCISRVDMYGSKEVVDLAWQIYHTALIMRAKMGTNGELISEVTGKDSSDMKNLLQLKEKTIRAMRKDLGLDE